MISSRTRLESTIDADAAVPFIAVRTRRYVRPYNTPTLQLKAAHRARFDCEQPRRIPRVETNGGCARLFSWHTLRMGWRPLRAWRRYVCCACNATRTLQSDNNAILRLLCMLETFMHVLCCEGRFSPPGLAVRPESCVFRAVCTFVSLCTGSTSAYHTVR